MENTILAVLPTASLQYREGTSDKIYNLAVIAVDGGHQVRFEYGRRGSTLTSGFKPASPVAIEVAIKQFDKLCKEKVSKGYKLIDGDGAQTMTVIAAAKVRSGLDPQVLNKLDETLLDSYLNDDQQCMQEKKDGRRLMVRKIGAEIIGSNKLGFVCPIPKATEAELSALPCNGVELDGELVGDHFYVFDILSLNGNAICASGYFTRYATYTALLDTQDGKLVQPVPAYFKSAEKRDYLTHAMAEKLEGVVFKDINAPYTPGSPNSGGTQLKYPFYERATCIVEKTSGTKRSVAIALLDHVGNLVKVGNVTVPSNQHIPAADSLVEIRYLYHYEDGCLFQPVLLGERDDVIREKCTLDQITRIKPKSPIGGDDE